VTLYTKIMYNDCYLKKLQH